ncbi:DUF5998 family protein [Zhihengliuella sp.]|uniref:DUF5998 family protein n=1 Tax=Zhihengliuella sp. TaxID=1954483 RepID=UPI0028126B75|nr:DUF5998 family protein [Zhihengliuella sp.]
MFSRTPDALSALRDDLTRSGFYPHLVEDVIVDGLDGAEPQDHFIHVETHFDQDEVHRHVTGLVVTRDFLVIVHVDDQQLDEHGQHVMAQASTETVPLVRLGTVMLNSVFRQPHEYRRGDQARELTLAIAWTGSLRADLVPAGCQDQHCDADHGYTGNLQSEDLVLRISAEADGPLAVENARRFARTLRRLHTGAALAGRA